MARSFSAGSSQSISVASAPSINFGGGDFTVLAWVRFPVEPPNDSMIVGKRAGGFDGDEGWELKFNDGGNETIRWDVETDVTGRQRAEGTATNITNGNWHLIGADHTDGTPAQLQIWYDGAVIATKVANTPGTVDTVTPLVIAAAYDTPSNTNYLTGEVGPVFACARLLTLGEHQAIAAGFSARFLRPLPCFLMELISRASPEPDIGLGGLSGTLENAPGIVENPRMVFPRAADIGQDLWYEFGQATVAGQSSLTATVTRARPGASVISGQSSAVAEISTLALVSATIAGQSALTADLSPEAPLRAAILAQSALTGSVNINAGVGAVSRGRSDVEATLSANVTVVAAITGLTTVTATASARAPVSAQSDGQSTVTATAKRGRTISVSVGGQSALTSAATITAGTAAQIDASSSLSAFLSATVPLASSTMGTSGIVAELSTLAPVAASIPGSSGIVAQITRAQSAAATVAAQSTLTAETRALAPVSTLIVGQSGLTAAAVANVRPQAIIAGTSVISARPTYPGTKKTNTTGGLARWLRTVGGYIRQ